MAYRCTLKCVGLLDADLDELSAYIIEEFTQHRTWHQDVKCWHEDGVLFITTLQEFDPDGLGLLDEFGDSVIANNAGENGPITVVSVCQV